MARFVPHEDALPDDLTYRRALLATLAVALMAGTAWVLPEEAAWWLNIGVALAYLGIFFGTIGRLSFPFWMSFCARLFFLGCAGVHLDLGIHALLGEDETVTNEWHHMFFDIAQNIGAWGFFAGAIYYKTRVIDLRSQMEKRQAERMAEREQQVHETTRQREQTTDNLIEVAQSMEHTLEETKEVTEHIQDVVKTQHKTLGEKVDDIHDSLIESVEETQQKVEEAQEKIEETQEQLEETQNSIEAKLEDDEK